MLPVDDINRYMTSFLPIRESAVIAQVNKASAPIMQTHLSLANARTNLLMEKGRDILDSDFKNEDLNKILYSGPVFPRGIEYLLCGVNVASTRADLLPRAAIHDKGDPVAIEAERISIQQTLTERTESLIANPACNEKGRGQALQFAARSNNKTLVQKTLATGRVNEEEAKKAQEIAARKGYHDIVNVLEPFT